ncbi:hypothetical protein PR048_009628 [Dryococelus australis]|uniref:EGF-like domain-containing protein n=1 Tax=Dryococelus australis TaxID=614101 RepID=A0ABQ9I167_9NEOP|nr:hypothetical protein PR048_009628 [Dryococelus australis]
MASLDSNVPGRRLPNAPGNILADSQPSQLGNLSQHAVANQTQGPFPKPCVCAANQITDIDECQDPAVAARCVENAECCNLPAHFVCKCKPGFEGDGEVLCSDIDECKQPNSCGINAKCENVPGNYTCSCLEGYVGSPYDGSDLGEVKEGNLCCSSPPPQFIVVQGLQQAASAPSRAKQCMDENECEDKNACGPGAICTNIPGGKKCECPAGYEGDAYRTGCMDMDECARTPCGRDALCYNMDGTFRCSCPPGYLGDPMKNCTDVDECHASPCGPQEECVNIIGSFECLCPVGYARQSNQQCADVDECGRSNACGVNAKCMNVPGSYKCLCPLGFTGHGNLFCENINECEALEKPCGTNAVCENAVPGYNCLCPQGYVAKPEASVACEQVDVNILCKSNFDCVNNAECVDNQCFCQNGFEARGAMCADIDECVAQPCGPHATCSNTPGGYHCECEAGYVGAPPRMKCKAPCEDVKCGPHAFCKPNEQEAYCICEDGWTFNPSDIAAGCLDIDECDKVNGPAGRCGSNALCTNTPGGFDCKCSAGYSGNPFKQCLDIDECSQPGACGAGALCRNIPGSWVCQCPEGSVPSPDPKVKCVGIVTCNTDNDCPGNGICDSKKRCLCPEPNIGNDCRHPCETLFCSPNAQCMLINNEAKCICRDGYTGSVSTGGCVDINECAGNPCPPGAVCKNEPGSYSCECPGGFGGDPYRGGCTKTDLPFGCSKEKPCPSGEQCIMDDFVGTSVCICQRGYVRDPATGRCRDINECIELREKPACGLNALCKNLPGSYECQCPLGFSGNPFFLCEECNTLECQCQPPYQIVGGNCVLAGCSKDEKCPSGAECITITGGVSYCACPKGYRTLQDGSCQDVNECVESHHVCGYGAECINKAGSYECVCPRGYSGDPYHGVCSPDQVRCIADADCSPNEKCVQPGECVCPAPFFSDTTDSNKCKSPCERFPCGINAECTPSDPPKCMCLTGYKGDPMHGCIDVDECADNPCAYGAHCINEKGGFKCVCAHGMTGDAYKSGCVGSVAPKGECLSNNDCPGQLACSGGACVNPCDTLPCGANAYCEPDNHAAWCRCAIGYKEAANGSCVSLCNDVICGQNAVCIPTSLGPTCACLEGFIGNAFPGGLCVPDVCSPINPCKEPSVCVSGRCKQSCKGVMCGVGAICDYNTNTCVCNPFFIGNPDVLCMPPVIAPACSPGCGTNAHCEYGLVNQCVCNPGMNGNPYESCSVQERKSCSTAVCGLGARCREGINSIECFCPPGFGGNPYVLCEDVDECSRSACGNNAVCINTLGSYDCRCKEGFAGNPFVVCQPIRHEVCNNPATCKCSADVPCPSGYTCKDGQCKNLCANIKCGPGAICDSGKCVCPPGFSGDASSLVTGCKLQGQCHNDLDCRQSEICFQLGKGVRKCVDACGKLQCGPNALCVVENHRSFCICTDGFVGNPSDLTLGCQPERAVPTGECETSNDCKNGLVCAINSDGRHVCVNPCDNVACGQNEACQIDGKGYPACNCLSGFVWNPVSSVCEKPALPECTADDQCDQAAACRPDALGVLKCVAVCSEFTCPSNAICSAVSHHGQCQCLPGYTGNPNDRTGCKPAIKNQCTVDGQCQEAEVCRKVEVTGLLMCKPSCDFITCGPHAVCVVNNHVAQCQCPPGPYAGDPNDLANGCRTVPCMYNIDCPPTQLCNRLTHTCYDVCEDDACGTNAVCIAEDHRATCQCPPGFRGNPVPDVECVPTEDTWAMPLRQVVDLKVTAPEVMWIAPPQSTCRNGWCINPCEGACGPNALCSVVNRKPVCSCPQRFIPGPTGAASGCLRAVSQCSSDTDCKGDVCHGSQCKVVCRNVDDCLQGERCVQGMCQLPCGGHPQCAEGQACISSYCQIGCRANKDCRGDQACINSKCQDPCKRKEVCGPNAICRCENHATQCYCPKGFSGNPVPQQGCIRVPKPCGKLSDCPVGQRCSAGICVLPCSHAEECAVGERCDDGACVKVCYGDSNCLAGEVCLDGTCRLGCGSDQDCHTNQLCIRNMCRCGSGFKTGPGGCQDINECEDSPCHPTAKCSNTPGSYRCECPGGMVGDPFLEPGCRPPDECSQDNDCSDTLACVKGHCSDPCTLKEGTKCGPSAICNVFDHVATCVCPAGHLGVPADTKIGCFKVECITNEDCALNKYCDRQSNKCITTGDPEKGSLSPCHSGAKEQRDQPALDTKHWQEVGASFSGDLVQNFIAMIVHAPRNPCETASCGRGTCTAKNHEALCICTVGYSLVNGKCIDIDECIQNPCHKTAICKNNPGSFSCVCPDGLIGDPIKSGCRNPGDCFTHSDCPTSAACMDNRCRNPCDEPGVCGRNAECSAQAHMPMCTCPAQTRGDPKVECKKLECSDSNDCVADKACVDSRCINPCSLPNACGKQAECTPLNHLGVCTCVPGSTGNPRLGCVPLQYCASDSQCPASTKCTNGICTCECLFILILHFLSRQSS